MADPSKNIMYLLWEKGVARSELITTLAKVLGCRESRAWEILEGQVPILDTESLRKLSSYGGVRPGELVSPYFLEGRLGEIMQENLKFLMGQLKHGQKKHLARKLKVNPTTISRWAKGTQLPSKKKTRELLSWFGLPPETDLRTEPVFLWPPTALPTGRRELLHNLIDTLDDESLRKLFPALIKLLMER